MSQTAPESTLSHAALNGGLRGIAKRLVKHGLLTDAQATVAETTAAELEISLLQHVIDSSLVDADAAAVAAAWEYGLPVVDLEAIRVSALPPASDYPVKILERLDILPLARHGHRLTVAVPYPATLTQLDELQFATGLSVDGVLAPADQLRDTLVQYLAQNERSMLDELENVDDAVSALNIIQNADGDEVALDKAEQNSEDAPVVKFVNKILLDAISRGASDIHFEPYEAQYRVRFRIDGMLLEIARPPFALRDRIAARLKIMSRLDISERRLPQDGALKLQLSRTRSIDFRVNSLPTVWGEKVVLRILDPTSAQLGIDQLGFSPEQQAAYEYALKKPQGMILVTGPTGSGKTVTLYTGINILNQVQRNICTAEDPVEIKVSGINQVNVLPKIGLNFASALRAFLRQDPDVVMVGEIRDLETAEIAVKAAQTGHLVLSTVHTNSAAETLTRLANMGVATYNIASSVSLIIAQRLARKLCNQCKTPADIPAEALRKAGFTQQDIRNATIYKAVGCKQCTQGYKGRLGVYEVVPITDDMRQLIMRDGNAIEIDQQARREGYPSLCQSCLSRVLDGSTSLEEVNRISKE
ncbi:MULTISPECIES: type IV-A pilus assembly ATPase PilB [unclassified Halomonas]|uniref:type IV-A pilus assembly ATPase PilB n=1 Tax=unclassified Halomonas TaxID=2609666 RepID=UPI001EF75141|nr:MULTISPECIES: type IV-A pilus assembly ATPase PilB [unclassified Halomonas]MCG7575341.1 type IV-A pilus assembly ATPase PilB [Halomonas sp. MMH1-48]MCG7602403.1 type IV-A pilus assembly ATPase PilB [Halomonas sp. MM17-34]MCG7611839.1 type IV-A pilus assembly ATPase PilB [Halomonas sp. MM17-29]MCG7618720.1 type IV-A pilus assembly ATPase PilB [Halomonas sp. DSH1-27]